MLKNYSKNRAFKHGLRERSLHFYVGNSYSKLQAILPQAREWFRPAQCWWSEESRAGWGTDFLPGLWWWQLELLFNWRWTIGEIRTQQGGLNVAKYWESKLEKQMKDISLMFPSVFVLSLEFESCMEMKCLVMSIACCFLPSSGSCRQAIPSIDA